MDKESAIKQKALELGFDAVGITTASPVDAAQAEYFQRWQAGQALNRGLIDELIAHQATFYNQQIISLGKVRKRFSYTRNIVLAKADAYAANTLWINDTLIVPRGFPNVRKALTKQGLPIIELDVSEMAKMDGGLTCLSLRF